MRCEHPRSGMDKVHYVHTETHLHMQYTQREDYKDKTAAKTTGQLSRGYNQWTHTPFRVIPGRRSTHTHLPGMVVLHLPAAGKLQLLVGEHVEEGDEVAVVLVALKVMGVPTHLADHVLQAGVARKHAVGTLGREGREVRSSERDRRETREQLRAHFTSIVQDSESFLLL